MSFPNGVVPTTQRVHPTPLYEFFIWLAIAASSGAWERRLLRESMSQGRNSSALYRTLTGIARFLIEFIRINPRSFFGMTQRTDRQPRIDRAGAVFLVYVKRRFRALKKPAAAVRRNCEVGP